MIRLKVIDASRNHFSVEANEPVRVEVYNDTVAHVYRGSEPNRDEEPVGAYDSNLPAEYLKGWEAPTRGGVISRIVAAVHKHAQEHPEMFAAREGGSRSHLLVDEIPAYVNHELRVDRLTAPGRQFMLDVINAELCSWVEPKDP